MNRDHIVFAVCGFLLGLVIGSFLLGPRLARSKLAGTAAVEMPGETAAAAAMPSSTPDPSGAPSGSPMAAVRQQLDTLKAAIEKDPRNFDALVQLANMYMDVGKFPQAIGYYEQALNVREEPQVRTDLGICYKQSGQADKAIAAFQKVAGEQPDQWQAVYNLAIVYAETRRFDEARAQLAKLRAMNADPAEVAKLENAIAGK